MKRSGQLIEIIGDSVRFMCLWTKGKEQTELRFIVESDRAQTHARLAMVSGVRTVIASGLELMGVEPLEELR